MILVNKNHSFSQLYEKDIALAFASQLAATGASRRAPLGSAEGLIA